MSSALTFGSLFAGIGGFDLAARWMGWDHRWVSEIDPYACRVLQKNFPDVPNLGDITQLKNPPPVDVLAGGFPCQDISVAGKGAGITGERSGLWKEYARIIGEISPRYIVIENSPMLRSRGMEVILHDLDALGYDAEWHCIPAYAVGAPHSRDRIWIIAYRHGECEQPMLAQRSPERSEAVTPAGKMDVVVADRSGGDARIPHVADSMHTGLEGHPRHEDECDQQGRIDPQSSGHTATPRVLGGADHARWWLSEPAVGRVVHGIPSRVDRMRCLGNAVVPQVPLFLFTHIQQHEERRLRL